MKIARMLLKFETQEDYDAFIWNLMDNNPMVTDYEELELGEE